MYHQKWDEQFFKEIQQAEIARNMGNEGMARVCARRAAGIAIEEYLERSGQLHTTKSKLTNLEYIKNSQQIPERIKTIAVDFLIHVTPQHTHPTQKDLIHEAKTLRELFKSLEK